MSIVTFVAVLSSYRPFVTGDEINYGYVVRPGEPVGFHGQYAVVGGVERPIYNSGALHPLADQLLVQPALAAHAPFQGHRSPPSSLLSTSSSRRGTPLTERQVSAIFFYMS